MRRSWWGIVAALAGLSGCTNAGESLTLQGLATGTIQVGVYFDRDDSGTETVADTLFAGVKVALIVPGGQDTLRRATTNSQGIALFDSLPMGTYRVVIDRHALADSVGVIAGDTGTVRLTNQPDSVNSSRLVRLGYTEVSLAQMRKLPVGRRVYIRGKVTVPLQIFRDTSTFITDTSGSMRILGTRYLSGQPGNNLGDSVLILGTTGLAQGEPVMLDGALRTIAPGLSVIPTIVSAADARTARNGSLDAALVQIISVVISDTAASAPDFLVKVIDPADSTATPTTILVDQLLNAPHSFFPIGASITVTGVLVPLGNGTWAIKPRGANDLIIN